MNTQLHDFVPHGMSEHGLSKLTGFDANGWPVVDESRPSRSLVLLNRSLIGCEVVVTQFPGDPSKLLILGVIQPPVSAADDGKTVIEADRALVLRCGKSSVSLEKGGKITIRGRQLLSRADGQNRVQGANVSLN